MQYAYLFIAVFVKNVACANGVACNIEYWILACNLENKICASEFFKDYQS